MFIGISQNVLGFLDFIINFVVNLVMWLFKVAFVKIMPVVWTLLGPVIGILIKVLATVLYAVMMLIFLIMDMLELMFRRISGLETFPGAVTFDGETVNYAAGEDLILTFIKTPQIQRIFWMMATVAVVLLMITTIIAIVRTEYADEKTGNSKGPIFGKALKAIALFFTVPIACTAGLMLANLLLKVVDNVTKGSNSIKFSGMVFYSVANSANRFSGDNFNLVWTLSERLRADGSFFSDNQQQPFTNMLVSGSTLTGVQNEPEEILGITPLDALTADKVLKFSVDRDRAAMAAEIVNTAFKYQIVYGDVIYNQGTKEWVGEISNSVSGQAGQLCTALGTFTFGGGEMSTIRTQALETARGLGLNSAYEDALKMLVSQTTFHTAAVVGSVVNRGFTVYNSELVFYFYDCITFNYILGILIGTTVLKVLLDLCMGCAVRLYKLVTLYAISPAIIALMPLDEKPFQQWTKKFVGLVTGLYGGVVALNMFFMISPLIYKINFFNDITTGAANPDLLVLPALTNPIFVKALNYLPQMLMVAAGAVSIRGISEMISQLIGAEDTMKEGAAVSAAVTAAVKGAMGPAGMAMKLAGKAAGGAANFATGGLAGKAAEKAGDALLGKKGEDGQRHGGLAGVVKNPIGSAAGAIKEGVMRAKTGGATKEERAEAKQQKEQSEHDKRINNLVQFGNVKDPKPPKTETSTVPTPDIDEREKHLDNSKDGTKDITDTTPKVDKENQESTVEKVQPKTETQTADPTANKFAAAQAQPVASQGENPAGKLEVVVNNTGGAATANPTAGGVNSGTQLVRGRMNGLVTQGERDRQDSSAKTSFANTIAQRHAQKDIDAAKASGDKEALEKAEKSLKELQEFRTKHKKEQEIARNTFKADVKKILAEQAHS